MYYLVTYMLHVTYGIICMHACSDESGESDDESDGPEIKDLLVVMAAMVGL